MNIEFPWYNIKSDVLFNQFKAIALVCDKGATLPANPSNGQWFLHTPTGRTILYQFNSEWIAIISIGSMTLYVDWDNGTDDLAYGHASVSSAFKSRQQAANCIPGLVGGNVYIHLASGTQGDGTSAADLVVRGKNFTGDYGIYWYGADFSDVALTINSATLGTDNSVTYGTITQTGASWGLRATLESGNTDGIGATANVLRDSGQNFLTTCKVGMSVKNTTDGTWAKINSVDSDTQLTLDTDIMDDGENYIIGWPEHKGKWITFASDTDTAALQGDIYLILDNTTDTLTIVGKFDALPTALDTAYISSLQTSINGQTSVAIGQLGVYFYRMDEVGNSSQITVGEFAEANYYQCDIKSIASGGKMWIQDTWIHKEDDVKTSNRLVFLMGKFTLVGFSDVIVDGEGLHYGIGSSVRGIDCNNAAYGYSSHPGLLVVQNFHAKSGVTNYGIYVRANAYWVQWIASNPDNWIAHCSVGLDVAAGSIAQYCTEDTYIRYTNCVIKAQDDAATSGHIV